MSFLKLQIQAAVAAFQFLTRIPIPLEVPFERSVLARSALYFPLAGGFIGICLGGMAWLLAFVLPPWPSAILLLAMWALLTGGLHLDGLMDTADGILSHQSRDKMLDIMKDSRVGAMGVIVAVLLLLLKASLIVELLKGKSVSGASYSAMFIICASWSRAWMAIAIAGWPPARPNEGIGALFNGVNKRIAAGASVVAIAISALTLALSNVNHLTTLFFIAGSLLVAMASGGGIASWLNRRLGGLTGDTYGAMNESVEVAWLLAAVIWMHIAG